LNKILSSHPASLELEPQRSPPRKRNVWSDYWFVNVGEGAHRNWDDNRRYGFISAGQGPTYSRFLKRLKVGDKIFAYMKKLGYVGYAEVTSPAVMIRDFVPDGESKAVLQLPLKAKHADENSDDPEMSEWAIGVKWVRSFPAEDARRFKGAFANQNVVCELRDSQTIEFLEREFKISN